MAPPKLTPGNSRGSSVASDNDNTSEADSSFNVKSIVGGPSSTAAAASSSLLTEQYYTIPTWLAGNEKHTAYKFSLDFPKVNGATRKAIEQYVRQNSAKFLKESTQASHQLHELQREESEAQRQVALAQENLDKLLVRKDEDLKKLRKEKQKAHAKKLHELERQMRQQHVKEWKKTEAKMEEEARADFEKSYEEEQQRKKENNKKRQREEEGQDEKVGQGQDDDEEEEQGDIKEVDERSSGQQPEQHVPKKQKTTADDGTAVAAAADSAETTTKSGAEGSNGGDKSSSSSSSQNVEEPSRESAALRLEIVGLEQKRDKVQSELDRLNERKKEIAWLLKQTIKGEMKQKKALLLAQRNKTKVEDAK